MSEHSLTEMCLIIDKQVKIMKYFIPRKDHIILSAIDIINELGIQGLSTKELASREQINESALYKHFKNKDAIILSVLEYFSQYDSSIYNTVLNKEVSSKEKILFYITAYLEYYESYPAITAILLHYESFCHESATKDKMKIILNSRNQHLIELLNAFIADSSFDTKFTSKELAGIINGFCDNIILNWRMEGCSYSFKEEAVETVKKLLS